jgi:hypothetical protein
LWHAKQPDDPGSINDQTHKANPVP